MSRRIRLILLILLPTAVATGALLRRLFPPPLPPLEISLWYWHQPFRIGPAELDRLRAMGVRQLFVRAGTFRKEGDGVRLIMPQSWESSAADLDVHLVFNFAYDIVRGFGKLSNEAIAKTVEEETQRERIRAAEAGVRVVGIQIDFDCPTRRLPKYADLLRRLRSALPKRQSALSITALPTWFTDANVRQVCEAVDFTVPQYYEADIPKTLDRFATVSHLRNVERGLDQAARQGRPFYVGLPAYGHALVYDEKGRLVGLYRDLGIHDLMHHPAFRLARRYPADAAGRPAARPGYIGEDIYDFVASVPASDGRGKGYHIVYDLPTPALVAQHLALVRAQRPRECRGVILFRYPQPGDTMALPLTTLAGAVHGAKAQPDLRVQVKAVPVPWELIDTGRRADRAPVDVSLTVTNVGTAGTSFAPEAVSLTLCLDRPGLEDANPRDFNGMDTFYTPQADPQSGTVGPLLRSGLLRANVIRFHKIQLEAGETAKIGPLRLPANGAGKIWGDWSAVGPGGFDILHGKIAPTTLTSEGKKRP